MDIAQEVFGRRRPIRQKLIDYGFTADNGPNSMVYRVSFMDGALTAVVSVRFSPAGETSVICRALDADTGDEYALINIASSTGAYVGAARNEYRVLLEQIAKECFYDVPFCSDQANRLSGMIENTYGVLPDNPFSNVDHAGVFRDPCSGKWFGLIMRIEKGKLLDKPDKAPIEIINVKIDPDQLSELLKEPGIYPCYHMNKKKWISVALDDSLDDDRIFELVRKSYKLIHPHRHWIIPSNPALFDVGAGFDAGGGVLTWHHRIHVAVGDTVYIYQTEPVAALRWKCEVIACSLETETPINHPVTRIMYLKRIETYDKDRYPRSWLNEHGIKKTVRGQRSAPDELVKALET